MNHYEEKPRDKVADALWLFAIMGMATLFIYEAVTKA